MKHYIKSLFAATLLALLLFPIGESTAIVAAADVSSGTIPTAKQAGAVRYKSFDNGGDREIYLGLPDLGCPPGTVCQRVEIDAIWQSSNQAVYTYYPTAGIQTTTVDTGVNTYSLTYPSVGSINLGTLNYVEILVKTDKPGTTVDFQNVNLNGDSLGNFSSVNGEGDKYWKVTGVDLTGGFTFTGTIVLTGSMPNSEHSKVQISVGYVPPLTITSSAGAGGSISPSGAVTVNYGANQSFTIAPRTGYHIVDVKVDNVSQGAITSYTFTNVTANHTIDASFAVTTHTITASAGANGTITPPGAVTVNYGANQSFTIAPSTGYHILDVKVDNVSQGAITSYTFTNVTANHTIDATFAVTTHTITASAGANGTITPSGAVTVSHGADQSYTITPNANYQVSDVLVDGASVGAVTSYTFNYVTASHTISASFVVIPPLTITTSSLPSGTVLNPYSQTLAATGGVLPYAWSVSSGSLPNGLFLNSSTGEISGSPTTADTFDFIVQVNDATLSTATKNFSIAIGSLPVRYGDPRAPINYAHIIQGAYDSCADGYIIQVQALELPEDLYLDRNVSITLKGGYDEGFTNNPSYTTIQGKLTISNGTVVIENIIIK